MLSNHMYTCFLRGEPTVTLEGVRPPLSCVLKCPRFRMNISPKQSLPLPFTLVRIPKIGATNYKRGMLTMIRTAQTNRKTHFKGKQDSSVLAPPELCSLVGYSLLAARRSVSEGESQSSGTLPSSGFTSSKFWNPWARFLL